MATLIRNISSQIATIQTVLEPGMGESQETFVQARFAAGGNRLVLSVQVALPAPETDAGYARLSTALSGKSKKSDIYFYHN